MLEFLTSNNFQGLVLPLVTTLLTIFIRMVSRPDHLRLDRSVFNVGINLCVTATFILVTKCVILAIAITSGDIESQSGMETMLKFWLLVMALIVGMFGLAYIIRKLGWEKNFMNEYQLKIFQGIIIPDFVGILYLILVFTQSIPTK